MKNIPIVGEEKWILEAVTPLHTFTWEGTSKNDLLRKATEITNSGLRAGALIRGVDLHTGIEYLAPFHTIQGFKLRKLGYDDKEQTKKQRVRELVQ